MIGPRWNVGGRGPAGPCEAQEGSAFGWGVPVGPACHGWWGKEGRVERGGSESSEYSVKGQGKGREGSQGDRGRGRGRRPQYAERSQD